MCPFLQNSCGSCSWCFAKTEAPCSSGSHGGFLLWSGKWLALCWAQCKFGKWQMTNFPEFFTFHSRVPFPHSSILYISKKHFSHLGKAITVCCRSFVRQILHISPILFLGSSWALESHVWLQVKLAWSYPANFIVYLQGQKFLSRDFSSRRAQHTVCFSQLPTSAVL